MHPPPQAFNSLQHSLAGAQLDLYGMEGRGDEGQGRGGGEMDEKREGWIKGWRKCKWEVGKIK